MKLANFRVRDRIYNKNTKTGTVANDKEEDIDEKIPKQEESKLSSLLNSFENIITTLVQSNCHKGAGLSKYGNKSSSQSSEVDFRDRFIIVDTPDFEDRKIDEEKLEIWLGDLCTETLSVAFHYLMEKKMSYNQMKAFASESFLRNIVILADNCDLTSKQMEFIDKKMKEKIFPYLKTKYPLTVENEINKALQRSVKSIDNSQMAANDYLYSSKVVFQFRQNGRYDDLIMRLLNQIMSRCDQKSSEDEDSVSNFKEFQNVMTNIFEKTFDPEWMNENNKIENSRKDQKAIDKYQQKVKDYTSYLIGRKISENTRLYTQEEIQSQSINIKSPAILRILTKWSEQLWAKFENENYFWDRKDGLTLNGTQKICLIEQSLKINLTDQIKKQKKELITFIKKITHVNYTQQVKVLECELDRKDDLYIEKYEKISGIFSCKIVNNLESFIIDYLNRLIHGLISVSRNTHWNLTGYAKYLIPIPLNLLSFTVSDILRCKYASKERQVLKMFKEIQKLSELNPQKFKIIRIKNRLQNSTNDIMINTKLNNQINCEIQIAVNATHSDFMTCSNKINHYIYELQRAQFGPILEMCSVWKTCEKRSEIFLKMIEDQKSRKKNEQKNQQNLKNTQKIQKNMIPCKDPFVCSQCSKHYYQNNFIFSHQHDKNGQYWKCAPCLISQNFAAEKRELFFANDKNIGHYKFCRDTSQVPNNGACILMKKPITEVLIFKKFTYKLKDYLVCLHNNKLQIMRAISSEKDKKRFFKDFLVFDLPVSIVNMHFGYNKDIFEEQLIARILLPDYLKNCLKEERQAVSVLNERFLSKLDINKILEENRQKEKYIQSIEFSRSLLTNLDLISPKFQNLTRLVLFSNRIENIQKICEFKNLERIHFGTNKIKVIPQAIGNLKKLKELLMHNNEVEFLPLSFFGLESLIILDMGVNKLKKVPQELQKLQNLKTAEFNHHPFGQFPKVILKLKKLQSLNLQKCGIKQLPEEIGDLKHLQTLNFTQNSISRLPQSIQKLVNLKVFEFQINQLQQIPQFIQYLTNLEQLNLKSNQLKQIPNELGCLSKLTILQLGTNKLQKLSSCIFKLKNLTLLKVDRNKIEKLPDGFDQLTKLKELNIEENKIKQLPETFRNLNLQKFEFKNNPIQEIKIDKLPKMEKISLTYNYFKQLKALSCEQSNLQSIKHVKQLDFRFNAISHLSQALFKLQDVQNLYLTENNIIEIPDMFNEKQKLKNIKISSNPLIALPQSIKNLKNLTFLSIVNNKFPEFPSNVCYIQNLKILYLCENKLKEVPEDIKNLKNLQVLWLDKNQFEQIPESISQLPSLKQLNFNHNQVKQIPLSICYNILIQKLNLIKNRIEKVPRQIIQMKSLSDDELKLKENPIKQVGDEEFVLKKFPGWRLISQQLIKNATQNRPAQETAQNGQ